MCLDLGGGCFYMVAIEVSWEILKEARTAREDRSNNDIGGAEKLGTGIL